MPSGATVTLDRENFERFLRSDVSRHDRVGFHHLPQLEWRKRFRSRIRQRRVGHDNLRAQIAIWSKHERFGHPRHAVRRNRHAHGQHLEWIFRVVYQGTAGWASTTYLSTGGGGGGSGSGLIIWPMASGGAWEIIQGYQGGTHNGTDTHLFDLAQPAAVPRGRISMRRSAERFYGTTSVRWDRHRYGEWLHGVHVPCHVLVQSDSRYLGNARRLVGNNCPGRSRVCRCAARPLSTLDHEWESRSDAIHR